MNQDKCPYHDELVLELHVVEKTVNEIEKTLITLNDTCKHLEETTVKSKEFYDEMLKRYVSDSESSSTIFKNNWLLTILLTIVGALAGYIISVSIS